MNREEIDRLLEEGLRHYSRVEPPEDFALRLEVRVCLLYTSDAADE